VNLTDSTGHFRLPLRSGSNRVTAAKPGYFIAGTMLNESPLRLVLSRLPEQDHESYAWVSPVPDAAQRHNCGNCHAEIYREWSASGHARSLSGQHFRNLYDGTDQHGQPNHGWNLLAEHPDGAGVCAACHAPTASAFSDLRRVTGVAAQGVHCDYCHKIADVDNEQIGLTHGRFGFKLLRPAQGQLFFGPLDDVDRGDDAFSPLYRDSRYCASCHEGVVFGVHVYSTYSEWLDSAARRDGKQCQTCHMAPTGTMTNLAPGKGGLERDPATLANHRFFDGSLETMLRRCLRLTLRLEQKEDRLRVNVQLWADDVGHRVPTGFVDRHLILAVEAFDQAEKRLSAERGPVLPPRAGAELAGIAGKLYAKHLQDFEGHGPAPFWRADANLVDTRLAPASVDDVALWFSGQAQRLRLRLVYRRFWAEVATAKSWPDNELVLIDQVFPLRAGEFTWTSQERKVTSGRHGRANR
jgi:hypothetical protein